MDAIDNKYTLKLYMCGHVWTLVPTRNSVHVTCILHVCNIELVTTCMCMICKCLLNNACWPAVRPTSTRSMALDFSHNKGTHIRLTKVLF